MQKSSRVKILAWIFDNIAWFILGALVIIFSLTIEGFAQWPIYRNILSHAIFVGILAIAEALRIISGEMDLSTESVMALAAVLTAYLAGTSTDASGLRMGAVATLAIVIAVGALMGFVNAFFVVKMKINSFIVTLAGYLAYRAVGLVITGGRGVLNIHPSIVAVARTGIGPIPMFVIIMVALYAVFHWFLGRTKFGRYIYYVGDSRDAAFNAGIRVSRVLFGVFILSSVLSAVAGWLLAARTNGSSPSLGMGMLFEAMAAVVIGGVSLQGGIGRLSGVFAGALLLSSISTVISIVGMNPFYMNIIRGALILAAVTLDIVIRNARARLTYLSTAEATVKSS